MKTGPATPRHVLTILAVGTPSPLQNSVYSPHIYTGVFMGNWKNGDVARIRASVQKARQEA